MVEDEKEWIDNLADRHVGREDEAARRSWHMLFDSVFVQVPRTLGITPCYRPEMDKSNKRTAIDYNPVMLQRVWDEMLQVRGETSPAFRTDVVTVGRQVVGNAFAVLKSRFDRAYHHGDIPAMEENADRMQWMLLRLDSLASYEPHSRLDTWLSEARAYAEDAVTADYYERNARTLITTWGGNLNDYAARGWAGLFGDYYAGRWAIYCRAVLRAANSGEPFSQAALDKQLDKYEESWTLSTEVIRIDAPSDDLVAFSLRLRDDLAAMGLWDLRDL